MCKELYNSITSFTFTKDGRVYPLLKEIKEALKHFSLAFIEFEQVLSWLPLLSHFNPKQKSLYTPQPVSACFCLVHVHMIHSPVNGFTLFHHSTVGDSANNVPTNTGKKIASRQHGCKQFKI